MRLSTIGAGILAAMLAAAPLSATAALYIDAKTPDLVMHSLSLPHCHIDSKQHAHCEDYVGPFPGQLNLSFGGRRPGCVVGGIRQYEYKPAQYRWDATVYKDFSKECHGVWQNNNTLWIYGTEK